MAQDYKQLLLTDLCARSPYGVKVSLQTGKRKLTGVLDAVYPADDRVIVDNLSEAIAPINVRTGGFLVERDNVKPYLRPMSSMTKEEKEVLKELCSIYIPTDSKNIGFEDYGILVFTHHLTDNSYSFKLNLNVIDWLNAHHFDYRGLIEKGLALEAPEGMYK